jgi:hypothetical protein
MKYIKITVVLLVGLAWFTQTNAQVSLSKVGQSTMDFLLVSTSPIASGLGEAYTTLGTGVESIYYNPAGLAETPKTVQISVDYTQWIADINYLSGAVAYNLGNWGSFGFHFLTVNYGTIIGTRILVDASGNAYGSIDTGPVSNVSAYSAGLSYAKAISTKFSMGGTIKLVGQNLGVNYFPDGSSKQNNATKLAFDAGVKYKTDFNGFAFAMSIRNFASDIKREIDDEQLPLTFTLGGAISLTDFFSKSLSQDNNVLFAIDFLQSNSYSPRANIGLEYKYMNLLTLRGGYQTNRDVMSWSTGLGINTTISNYDVEVNYSFSKMVAPFNSVSRLEVGFNF